MGFHPSHSSDLKSTIMADSKNMDEWAVVAESATMVGWGWLAGGMSQYS